MKFSAMAGRVEVPDRNICYTKIARKSVETFSGNSAYESRKPSGVLYASRFCLILFRAENPVAGVAQSRADISVLIQAAVQMPHIDLDIRMRLMQAL